MQQIYKIDETRIANIKKRAYFRAGKIMLIVLLVWALSFAQQKSLTVLNIVLPLGFSILIYFFTMSVAVKRLATSYKTMRIIVNDEGVEVKANMMPFKSILWQNLTIDEKNNGLVYLNDITYSAFTRKMYGRGCIILQPEILDKDKLMAELHKNAGSIKGHLV